MQRILSLPKALAGRRSLLALVVLFCLAILSASAQQQVTQNHIKYSITPSTQTAAVTGTDGTIVQNVVILDSVANSTGKYFPVVSVNSNAFKGNANIKSVVFGSNLEKIGSYAFSGCGQLTEVIIPEGVVTIDNYAFQNCAIRYADLPSTLRVLGSGTFKTNGLQLDTLLLRTAFYDDAGQMNILPFSTSCFSSKALMKNCVLMVPKKAYDYYAASTTSTGLSNWGYFFTNISAFGTAPSSCSVVPKDELKDYRDLAKVDVTFTFDDETLTDVLSLGPDDHIEATLVLPDGKSLSAGDIALKGNTISIDFAEVLQRNRELFIATSDDNTAIDVQLRLDGQIQLEECPYMLASFFTHHPISWTVPLLPSVYDLPEAPAVEPDGDAEDGRYSYEAFEAVTLKFEGYTGVSLDSSTGAYINARLFKNGEPLTESQSASVSGDNTITIHFAVPTEDLLVRRSSGIEDYDFTLEVEGQVNMMEGNEEKNFRFTLPFASTAEVPVWKVQALYIPEPTGVSILPADGRAELTSLADVAVSFEGVKTIALASDSDETRPLVASLYMEGGEILRIGADKVRVVDNTLHLLFGNVDERLITLITADKDFSYRFSMSLVADLMTDGYPCRVVIGDGQSKENAGSGDVAAAVPYTRQWTAPLWDVPAKVCAIPEVSVNVPAAVDGEVTEYQQLRSVELIVENYTKVVAMPAGAYTTPVAEARLLRAGNPVCVVNDVTTEGNKIIIDFSKDLTYNAVGITPDDVREQLIDLSLYFEGDLVFDGIPYHFVYDGAEDGQKWSLQPVVVYKLPTPGIKHDNNWIYFTCGVEDIEYHYTITNADACETTTQTAVKGNGGSSLQIPLTRRYVISVYVTREGYEDSEVVSVTLDLTGDPVVRYDE